MKRGAPRPVVITNAERSQEDQLRTRTRRYVAMMSVRVVCLILAVVLVSLQPPLLWLWLLLCALGMTVVPWLAVIFANERLPKRQHQWRRPEPAARPGLPAGPTDRSTPSDPPVTTIEVEPEITRPAE